MPDELAPERAEMRRILQRKVRVPETNPFVQYPGNEEPSGKIHWPDLQNLKIQSGETGVFQVKAGQIPLSEWRYIPYRFLQEVLLS